MRRNALALGIILLLAGVFLMDQSAQIMMPLAAELGQTSHLRTQSVLVAPTLLAVAPANQTWIPTHVDSGTLVAGSFQVGTGREINFYVMDENSFRDWRAGRHATVILAVFSTGLYKFNLTLASAGNYYFIFENQENVRSTVVFQLNIVNDAIIISPIVEYLPFALAAAGFLLLVWGATGGRKKARPLEEATEQSVQPSVVGWKCTFCGATNAVGEKFCKGCGRSSQ